MTTLPINPPVTATGAQVPNIFETSNDAFQTGVGTVGQGAGVIAGTASPFALPVTMNQLMNPYISNVINDTVGRLRERKAIDLSNVQTQAAQASAFGGARHGLVEAELIDAYGQQEDELVSRLLQQGFDTSSTLALNELTRRAGAGSALAGTGATMIGAAPTGLSMGQTALAGQMSAGQMQQNLIQQILTGADLETQAYLNRPMQSLTSIMAGLAGNPLNQAGTRTTTTTQPVNIGQVLGGLFGLLGGK